MKQPQKYEYVIVGAGLAGASAVKGIREVDAKAPILMLGRERHLPYDRPPLSKRLWTGKATLSSIVLHDAQYYDDQGVELVLGRTVVALDPATRTLTDNEGNVYQYGKLLLATGGMPKQLPLPGASLRNVYTYRTLDDYLTISREALPGSRAVIIGGGFIGAEMAAALRLNGVDVTMVFPEPHLGRRIFPQSLGQAIQSDYLKRGVSIHAEDVPVGFEQAASKVVTFTSKGQRLTADFVITGTGILPSQELAAAAGISTGNGIVVDEFLATSDANIFAAGDNAHFPYSALGLKTRVEHWDNALNQGRQAGRNMAGAHEPYSYMPYFYSDLFDFGFEAVGEIDSSLEIQTDWVTENTKGIVYYLRNGLIRGVMLCDIWSKLGWARELIKKQQPLTLRKAA